MNHKEIEESGWIYVDLVDGKYLIDNYYKITIEQKYYKVEFRLRLIGDNTTIWSEDTDSTYFDGTIGGIDELKVLMRQIGCV